MVCLAGVGVESGVLASPAPCSGSGGGPFQVRLAGWSLAGWLPWQPFMAQTCKNLHLVAVQIPSWYLRQMGLPWWDSTQLGLGVEEVGPFPGEAPLPLPLVSSWAARAPRSGGAWQGGSLGPAWSWMMLVVAGASWGYRFGCWSCCGLGGRYAQLLNKKSRPFILFFYEIFYIKAQ